MYHTLGDGDGLVLGILDTQCLWISLVFKYLGVQFVGVVYEGYRIGLDRIYLGFLFNSALQRSRFRKDIGDGVFFYYFPIYLSAILRRFYGL